MQSEKLLFKVWNVHRTKKICLLVDSNEENIYEFIVLRASEKMDIDGSQLVLENDGSLIDDSELLRFCHNETLILLEKNQIWCPNIILNNIDILPSTSTSSLPSTVTISSEISSDELSVTPITNVGETCSSFTVTEPVTSIENTEVDSDRDTKLLQPKRIHEHNWRLFTIPWEKLPKNIFDDLTNGKKSYRLKTEVVRFIINEMRSLKTTIPSKSFSIVAHKIIEQFPHTFKDTDEDGNVLGDGSYTLIMKMQERNNYLNRPIASKKKSEENVSLKESMQKKRKAISAKAGCSHWEVEKTEETNTSKEAQEAKITMLKEEHLSLEDSKIRQLVEETYVEQRDFLNNYPTIKEIRSLWPCLLNQKVIAKHYELLTSIKYDEIELTLRTKYDKIIKYGVHKKVYTIDEESYSQMSLDAKYYEAIKIIFCLLKEDIKSLIFEVDDSKGELQNIITAPCLITTNGRTYHVAIEKEKVSSNELSFIEAIKFCYAACYVFNMKYPPKAAATFEWMQIYLTKNCPDQGTKSSSFLASKKKVITLVKKLAEF